MFAFVFDFDYKVLYFFEAAAAAVSSSSQPSSSLFSDKFNIDIFNATFDAQKDADPAAQMQLIERVEDPSTALVYGQQAGQLGEESIGDFSGETSQLGYTDLKRAHSSSLIHAARVKAKPSAKTVDELQAQRENISFDMSAAEAERRERLRAAEEELEQRRLVHLRDRDQLAEEQHNRVQQLMIGGGGGVGSGYENTNNNSDQRRMTITNGR